jgi:hypothetical protein
MAVDRSIADAGVGSSLAGMMYPEVLAAAFSQI